MLVLTRKINEAIHIGENIVLKVVQIRKSTVKLGIEAPIENRVLRAEIYDDVITASRGDVIDLSEKQVEEKTEEEAA